MTRSLFIFTVLCTVISCSSAQSPLPVRDTNRNLLRSGSSYYILPVIRGRGGGITLAPGRDRTCPLDVVQDNNFSSKGLPVNFAPANISKDTVIRESTDLNIIFSGTAPRCVPTAVWRVEGFEGSRYVSSQGMVGNPGHETIKNWFKIEKYGEDYKLTYCPTVCNNCGPLCEDVGSVIAENGRRTLVLNNKPLKVKFLKA